MEIDVTNFRSGREIFADVFEMAYNQLIPMIGFHNLLVTGNLWFVLFFIPIGITIRFDRAEMRRRGKK